MNKASTPCNHRPECDGCPLFEYQEANQHRVKRAKLEDGLIHYPTLAKATVFDIEAAPVQLGYRNRARMVTNPKAKSAQAFFGFYQRGSRTFLPITTCLAHETQLEDILQTLRTLTYESPLRPHLQFIDVRWLNEQALATLCLGAPGSEEDLEQWKKEAKVLADALKQHHDAVGVRLNISTKHQAIYSGDDLPISAPDHLTFAIDETRQMTVSPGAFFQLNTAQLHHTHALMKRWLGGAQNNILDLYCGIGVHGLAIASGEGHVWGTDSHEGAITAATQNAQTLNIPATYSAQTDKALGPWFAETINEKLDAIIINPARAGMSSELIVELKPEMASSLLYLSCEPKTLRRDLARLTQQGWQVVQLQPLDFMPKTDQVETLVLLKPSSKKEEDVEQLAFWPTEQRTLPLGVSGIKAKSVHEEDRVHWIAFVSGHPSSHGQPTHLPKVENEELRVVVLCREGKNSWISITSQSTNADHICHRLRAWGFPVFGDTSYGKRKSNQWFKRKHHGDRVALHCALITPHDQPPSKQRLLHYGPGVFFEWGLEPPYSTTRR